MRMRFWVAIFVLILVSCTSSPPKDSSSRFPSSQQALDPSDPSLVDTRSNALTVWKALEMARTEAGAQELDRLFAEEAVSLSRLPVGYSAGTGLPFPGFKVLPGYDEIAKKALSFLTGRNWRGKIFCPGDAMQSHGYNRILDIDLGEAKELVLHGFASIPIMPVASFRTYLINPDDPRDLARNLPGGVRSNVVILNYAEPSTKAQSHRPFNAVEGILQIPHGGQVFDVMVAVRGKYGPLYLGKTWLGKYDPDSKEFKPDWDALVARYFLDFNAGALEAQKADTAVWPAGAA